MHDTHRPTRYEAGAYSIVDLDAHAGVSGYEIRQVNGRGAESYLGFVAFTPQISDVAVEFGISRLASPFSSGTSFALALPARLEGRAYSVALYDNAGRLVKRLAAGTVASASLDVRLDGAGLRAGVYHVLAVAGDARTTAKIVKL